MTIAEWLALGKETARGIPSEKRFAGAVVAATAVAFGLGVVASRDWQFAPAQAEAAGQGGQEKGPAPASMASTTSPTVLTGQKAFVASKTGSKYYLPSCSGAKRIKTANQVWFATQEAAQTAGYEPSTTCKGLTPSP